MSSPVNTVHNGQNARDTLGGTGLVTTSSATQSLFMRVIYQIISAVLTLCTLVWGMVTGAWQNQVAGTTPPPTTTPTSNCERLDSSLLLEFHKGDLAQIFNNDSPLYINQLVFKEEDFLEMCHDYVQWALPTLNGSSYNRTAPVLNHNVIIEFNNRQTVGRYLRYLLSQRILPMWGFKATPILVDQGMHAGASVNMLDALLFRPDGWVIECSCESKLFSTLYEGGHNMLRVTRAIESATLLGEKSLAEALLKELERLFDSSSRLSKSWSKSFPVWKDHYEKATKKLEKFLDATEN